VKSDQYRCA